MDLIYLMPFVLFGLLAASYAFALFNSGNHAGSTEHPDTPEMETESNE
jgi:hypothetical protein